MTHYVIEKELDEMGCDIHFVVEVRRPGGEYGEVEQRWLVCHDSSTSGRHHFGEWGNSDETRDIRHVTFDQFEHRNYAFFAALAGVRGDGPAPIGLPPDATGNSLYRLDKDDGIHSQSWLSLEKFTQAYLKGYRPEEAMKTLVKDQLKDLILDTLKVDPKRRQYFPLGDYRVVFGFDN